VRYSRGATAKADTLSLSSSSGNTATFSNVTIAYVGTNPVSTVYGNTGTTATASESATITGIGTRLAGIQIGTLPSSNAGSGAAVFNTCSASSCLGTGTLVYVNLVPSGTPGSRFSGLAAGGADRLRPSRAAHRANMMRRMIVCSLTTGDNFNACNT